MPWIKLDDRRATHRKLRQAGFAARGLDEAGMCQVSFDGTDGFISTEAVETLALAHREKQWRKLAALLVQVGRWEEAEGGWIIHDYLDYNPTAVENEAQRRHLSEVRSEAGRRGGQASGQARRPPSGEATSEANGKQVASSKPEANSKLASKAPSRPVKTSSSSVVTNDARPERPDDDDDPSKRGRRLAGEALDQITDQRMVGVKADKPTAYRAKVRAQVAEEHHAALCELDLASFADAAQIVELLEPAPKPRPPSPEDVQSAANEARYAEQEDPRFCDECGKHARHAVWCHGGAVITLEEAQA